MKKLLPSISLLIVFTAGCSDRSNSGRFQLPIVAIQPLEKIDSYILSAVVISLRSEFHCEVVILPPKQLPADAYHKPRKRYRADKLIAYLKREREKKYISVIGITKRDVSTAAHGFEDWGVMGLGYRPGVSCVISTFRAGRTAKDKQQMADRMAVLGLHEFGHNLDLPHCNNDTCMMQDAEGKNKLDQSKRYCDRCKSRLQSAKRLEKK